MQYYILKIEFWSLYKLIWEKYIINIKLCQNIAKNALECLILKTEA